MFIDLSHRHICTSRVFTNLFLLIILLKYCSLYVTEHSNQFTKINDRENIMVNREWTIQRNWKYWAHKKKDKYKKSQHKRKKNHELHQMVAMGKKFQHLMCLCPSSSPGFSGVWVAWSLAFCVVCHKSLFFHLAIVLSVILRFTDSDYSFGIFKLFSWKECVTSGILSFFFYNYCHE